MESISRQGHSWDLQLGWHDPGLGRYICEKGSVAVNGISLTVASCHQTARFSLAVIPTPGSKRHCRTCAAVMLSIWKRICSPNMWNVYCLGRHQLI